VAHLAVQPGPRVTLTFPEVKAIIGGPLPLVAWLLAGWWTGPGRPPHGALWAAAGWRMAAADAHTGIVTFVRDDAADGGCGHGKAPATERAPGPEGAGRNATPP
jgi:hypothetical protein